jgi:hypothetical protein
MGAAMNPAIFDRAPIEKIDDIDRLLTVADNILLNERRNAGVISMALMHVIKGKKYGLRFLENRYRILKSPTFLIGRPRETAPPDMKVLYPDQRGEASYFLWVCVNGQHEADETLAQLGYTQEENAQHLDETGFLMVTRH